VHFIIIENLWDSLLSTEPHGGLLDRSQGTADTGRSAPTSGTTAPRMRSRIRSRGHFPQETIDGIRPQFRIAVGDEVRPVGSNDVMRPEHPVEIVNRHRLGPDVPVVPIQFPVGREEDDHPDRVIRIRQCR